MSDGGSRGPFLGRHKQFGKYQSQITPAATPSLHRLMSTTEMNRADLARLVDALLDERPVVDGQR